MGDVILLDCATRLPIPPDRVLQQAIDAGVNNAIVIGLHNGHLYFASSLPNIGDVLLLLKSAEKFLLDEFAETPPSEPPDQPGAA